MIIRWPTGVWYANQSSETTRDLLEAEGIFVPFANGTRLDGRLIGLGAALCERFSGRNAQARTWRMTPAITDAIDALLAEHLASMSVTVARRRLQESRESWVFVTVNFADEDLLQGIPFPRDAIMTWPSSA